MKDKIKTFSFDIGTASIGWAVVETPKDNFNYKINHDEKTGEVIESSDSLEGIKILGSGVRMFNEPVVPKTFALLNVQRRYSRLARRRTRRVVQRKERIKELLLSLGYYKKEDFEAFTTNGETNKESVFQRVILTNQKEPHKHNIFYLRVKALDEKLTKDELAVVLYNLTKTRGFKSSKKIKKGESELNQVEDSNSESGKVLSSIKALENKQEDVLNNYGKQTRTFAELIYFLNSSPFVSEKDKLFSYHNKGSEYSNSILRSNIEQEVKLILAKQREFYKELTEEFEEKFLENITFQREVIFNLETVGKCTYIKDEFRASKSCFSSEYYIALGKLLNLRISKSPVDIKNLSKEEKDKFFKEREKELDKEKIHEILNDALKSYSDLTYKRLRKKLNLDKQDFFKGLKYSFDANKESNYAKDKIEENKFIEFKEIKKVVEYLEDLKKKNELSEENYNYLVNIQYTDDYKDNIFILDNLVQLNSLYNEKQIIKHIENDEILKNLTQEIKDAIIYCNLDFTKYLQLSLKAIKLMLPYMQQVYPNAEVNGIETSVEDKNNRWESKRVIDFLIKKGDFKEFRPKKEDKLPPLEKIKEDYYIPNHAVIIRAISQVRKTFNAMIDKFGKPDVVNIELLRELKNPSDRKGHINKREDNTIERENARKELKEMELLDTEANILMIKLWKEQNHSCPYCKEGISPEQFKQNDNYLQVDHIIPESLSLDNSYNNKVLVHTDCNQKKLQRTPYMWKKDNIQEWDDFKSRVYSLNLPRPKMDRLLNQRSKEEIQQGFIERQRNDSAYITVLIKDFIENYFAFPENSYIRHVYATKGALTKLLRDIFDFKKYRNTKELQQDKGRFLYREIVWNEERNPEIVEKLKSIQNEIKKAKKIIAEAKKQDEKEPEEAKKNETEYSKKLTAIKNGFIEYLPSYFGDLAVIDEEGEKTDKKGKKEIKIPKEIEEYVNTPSFSAYLTELKMNNNFDKKFKEMEMNFIGDKHHALDAILIGLATPSMIQGIGTLANQTEKILRDKANATEDIKEKNKLLKKLYKGNVGEKVKFLIENKDWVSEYLKSQNSKTYKINNLVAKLTYLTTLEPQIKESLDKIFISRQPNRKIMGRIHEDTIYSAKPTRKIEGKLTKRVDVSTISITDVDKKVLGTPQLKEALKNWLNNKDKLKFPTMPTKDGSVGPLIRKTTIITNESGDNYYSIRNGLVDSDKKIRVDVFKIKQVGKKGNVFYKHALRPINLSDILLKKEIPLKLSGNFGFLEKEDGGKIYRENKKDKNQQEFTEDSEFLFSLYPGDLFCFKKDEKSEPEYVYYLSYNMRNNIEYTDHNKLKKSQASDERLFLPINSCYSLQKAEVDLLGNYSIVKTNSYQTIKIKNKKER